LELPPNTVIPSIPPASPEPSEPLLPDSILDKYSGTNPNQGAFLNTPEPTDQLFRRLNFKPLTDDEPLMPCAEYYAVTICLTFNEITPDGCIETETTPTQTAEKLASFILNKSLKSVINRPFRIVFPTSMPEKNQLQVLHEIETKAISIIEKVSLQEMTRWSNHLSLTEEKRLQEQFLSQYLDIARQQADRGMNWTHILKRDKSIYNYNMPKIYANFKEILTHER